MNRLLLAAAMLLPVTLAHANDRALILNEQRQQALYLALDQAVRAQGIEAAPRMLDLLNVLRTAPAVTEQKPPEPAKPAPDNPQPESKKD